MYTRSAQKRPPGVFSTPFFFSNAASTQPEAGAHTCKAGLGKPPTLGARLSARLRAVASLPQFVNSRTVTDFADASHSKSAKSATAIVLYGIFSSENSYLRMVKQFNSESAPAVTYVLLPPA